MKGGIVVPNRVQEVKEKKTMYMPSIAKDLLKSQTPAAAPKPAARVALEKLSTELGVALLKYTGKSDVRGLREVVPRSDEELLQDCLSKVTRLREDLEEEKKITGSIDNLMHRYLPMYFYGP